MEEMTSEGVRVYALSYDEQEALADFQAAHDISYRFLSDPDSEVIRSFGILNTIISEDDHPWFGIPYPGTYLLDSSGVITHKFFENNLAVRVGPEQLLRALRGEVHDVDLDVGPSHGAGGEPAQQVAVDVYLDGETLAVSVQRELVARFRVPAGRHLYAQPAPAGCVAVTIELDDNPGLVTRDILRPSSEHHSLANSGESFQVHHGVVELRQPLTINGRSMVKEGTKDIKVSGVLRWQSCDDEVCDIPSSQRFELNIPIEGAVLPGLMQPEGTPSKEPRAAEHFKQMIERRQNA